MAVSGVSGLYEDQMVTRIGYRHKKKKRHVSVMCHLRSCGLIGGQCLLVEG